MHQVTVMLRWNKEMQCNDLLHEKCIFYCVLWGKPKDFIYRLLFFPKSKKMWTMNWTFYPCRALWPWSIFVQPRLKCCNKSKQGYTSPAFWIYYTVAAISCCSFVAGGEKEEPFLRWEKWENHLYNQRFSFSFVQSWYKWTDSVSRAAVLVWWPFYSCCIYSHRIPSTLPSLFGYSASERENKMQGSLEYVLQIFWVGWGGVLKSCRSHLSIGVHLWLDPWLVRSWNSISFKLWARSLDEPT